MDFGPDALQLFSRGLRLKAPLGFWQENLRASLKKKALVSCYWKTRKETSKGAHCQTFVWQPMSYSYQWFTTWL